MLFEISEKSLSVSDLLSKGYAAYRTIKLKWFFDRLAEELGATSLTEESIQKLIEMSGDDYFRKAIDEAVVKTILATSRSSIELMAIVVASTVSSKSTLDYDSVRLLRALQLICDDELLYLDSMYANSIPGIKALPRYTHNFLSEDSILGGDEKFPFYIDALERVGLIEFDRSQYIKHSVDFTLLGLKVVEMLRTLKLSSSAASSQLR